MFRKYSEININVIGFKDKISILNDWADNHKTIVIKNGGETNMMLKIKDLCSKMDLPYAYFHEPSLDDALTCVGIIVPERYYDRTIVNSFMNSMKRSTIENSFIDLLEKTRLAQ